MRPRPLTAEDMREIAAESGLAHAGFVLEQTESQLGAQAEARSEFERLAHEAFYPVDDDD